MGIPYPDDRSDSGSEEHLRGPTGRDGGAGSSPVPDPGTPETPGKLWESFRGRRSREILERLLDGDPLELEARCRAKLQESALLLDLSRLHLRALARVAHRAPHYRGEPPLGEWLTDRIEDSIQDLLEEDRDAERLGTLPQTPVDHRYRFVSELLGLEVSLARRTCVAFNDLPSEVRCAWFAVAVLGKSVNRYVAEGHGPPEEVKAHVKRALTEIAKAARPRLDEEEGGARGGP